MKVLAISVLLLASSAPGSTKGQKDFYLAQNNDANETSTRSSFAYNEKSFSRQNNVEDRPSIWWKRPEWWLCITGIPTLFCVGWQAKATADSVKTANRGLILQFRPKIVIRGGYVENADRSEEATMEFAVVNVGTSTAHLIESKLIAKMVDSYYPSDPLFTQSFIVSATKLEPGAAILHTFVLDRGTTEAIRRVDFAHRNCTGDMITKTIIFDGTLNYADEFKTIRQSGISRQYDATKKRFVPTNDPDYEYTD